MVASLRKGPLVRGATRWAAALVALGLGWSLAACTATPSSGPTPQTSAPATTAPTAPTAAPSSATPTPTPEPENSYTPPAKTPGRPDPSTAGSLSSKSFPNPVLGFTGRVVDPDEGEYNPNGTWVHAIDGRQAAYESLPQCSPAEFAKVPKPRAALSGTYRDRRGEPGNALGLEFADESAATAFFDLYADQLRACVAAGSDSLVVVTDLSVSGSTITGRRAYSSAEKWSELIKRSGTVVIMVILADGHRTSTATLAKTVATF